MPLRYGPDGSVVVRSEPRETRVLGGVEVVASQTSGVPDALTSVNAALKPVRDFCEGV